MKESDRFRDGIIDINTRQFGTVAEVVVKILKDCIDSRKLEFDLIDIDNNKIEVKASKVFRKQALDINTENFYDIIINNSNRDRLLLQKETATEYFDCNIQQIKIKLFDKLVYLLFFKDLIEIFEIDKKQIKIVRRYATERDRPHSAYAPTLYYPSSLLNKKQNNRPAKSAS